MKLTGTVTRSRIDVQPACEHTYWVTAKYWITSNRGRLYEFRAVYRHALGETFAHRHCWSDGIVIYPSLIEGSRATFIGDAVARNLGVITLEKVRFARVVSQAGCMMLN